jgi:DNA-binding transcriptional MerR regulator
MNTIFSTGQLARLLGIPAYKIGYAHSTGRIAEPAFRFLDKRCYTAADVIRVAAHFGVTISDATLKTAALEAQ